MSRFNNPKALAPVSGGQGIRSVAIDSIAPRTNLPRLQAIPSLAPMQAIFPVSEPRPNQMQVFCLLVLCTYLLSASANDITLHLFRMKAYISTVSIILLPLAFLASGGGMRGFRNEMGRWWFAFAIWLLLCAPFSVWRSDTVNLLSNYLIRDYLLYFVICACVTTVHHLRVLMWILGFRAFVVLVTCVAFGSDQSGRFSIAGSPFLSNANELGLQLLLGIIFLVFSFFGSSAPAKLIGGTGMLISASYMLKTGSRGVLLATLAVGGVLFLLSRRKWTFLALAIPAFVVTLVFTPAHTRHRLTLIFGSPTSATIRTNEELEAVGSQMQREQLLRESISYAFQHPLLGVGPGEFMVAEAGVKEEQGGFAEWRGTHNSYTQVASEAGLPGFIFYVAAILTCLRMSLRLYRRVVKEKGLEDLAGVSLCISLGTVGYAISTFFFHIAYSSYFPVLAGLCGATLGIAQRIPRGCDALPKLNSRARS